MTEEMDAFVKILQGEIFQEVRDAYGEKVFQHWLNPLHVGVLTKPDGYARLKGHCGDTMEVFLRFKEDIVEEASFVTDGCGSSTVCGSYATEMSLGKTPDEILDITGEAILEELGGLPQKEQHCAFLAAETLQEALHDYMVTSRERDRTKSGSSE